jgi:hypothetical protein
LVGHGRFDLLSGNPNFVRISLLCKHKNIITFVANNKTMRLFTKLTFARKPIALLLALTFSLGVFAQDRAPKLSVGVGMGIPVTLFSVKSKLVGIYTGSARYSFNKTWSLEAKLTSNTFYNNATGNTPKAKLDGTPSDVISYRTPVYGLTGVVYYNLHNIFGLNRTPDSKWLPFISGGAGYNWYKPGVTYANGKTSKVTEFGKPYRDFQLGIGTRYYLNPNLDLFGGAEYHVSETYYLDGFKEANNPTLDQYLNFYAGVSVKLGAKPWNNLVDWSHKNIENPKESAKDYSKLAVDGTLGIPFLFTPVGHSLTGMFGLGARYSFNKAMGLQLNYSHGAFKGSQDVSGTPGIGTPDAVKDFKTKINQYTLRAYFNVRNLSGESQTRALWNHYVIVGGGYMGAKGDATFANGKTQNEAPLSVKPGIQTILVGYEARKYLTHNFDLIAGVDFSYNQSKWLDQGYDKKTLNNHLYFHTGVTYKIGTNKDREHIDWSYSNYNNYKDKSTTIEQVPVIEKPAAEQPKIDTSKMAVVAPVEPVSEPVVVEPTPVVVEPTPEPVKPVVQPTPAPKPTPTPKPAPVVTPKPAAPAYVATDEVTPPPSKYNVIVGCYSVNKLAVAENTKARLARKGYDPSIYRSSNASKLLRLAVISTDDKAEALKILRKARKEIDPYSWMYLYNAQ